MKIKWMAMSVVMMGMAGSVMGQTAPQPLPQDYQVLARKSIFSRDRMVPDLSQRGRNWQTRPRDVQPRRNFTPVFIGVLLEDAGDFVAYVQDPTSGNVTGYHVGDALQNAAGVVKAIDLDSMSVEADKQVKRIPIGLNILGGNAEYPSAAPAASAPSPAPGGDVAKNNDNGNSDNGGPPNNGGPNGGGPDNGGDNGGGPPQPAVGAAPAASGSTGRLPGESMIDYFKRRRAMQLNKQ